MAKFKPTMEMPHAKILIVDDSSFTRELVSKMLVQAGFSKPLEAESAGSALGAVKANKPDLLILDIDLGGELDGVDVLRAVKRDTPAVKVIVLSALSQRIHRQALPAGAAPLRGGPRARLRRDVEAAALRRISGFR